MMDKPAFNEGYAAAQSLMSLKPPYLPSVAFYGFRLVPFRLMRKNRLHACCNME